MLRGGVADKLGNDYEAHWTLIEALRVLRGHADENLPRTKQSCFKKGGRLLFDKLL
jgi:hypothetical protein